MGADSLIKPVQIEKDVKNMEDVKCPKCGEVIMQLPKGGGIVLKPNAHKCKQPMTEQEKQAIRERLDKISCYPWGLDDTNGCIWSVNGYRLIDLDPNIDPYDAEFIANAPEDMSRLLDVLDEQDREVDRLHVHGIDCATEISRLDEENQRLQQEMYKWNDIANERAGENQRLRKALEFYANDENWRGGLSMSSNINVDGGEIARQALAGEEIERLPLLPERGRD